MLLLIHLSHAGNEFQWTVIAFLIPLMFAMLLVIIGICFIKEKTGIIKRYVIHCTCVTRLNFMLSIKGGGKGNIQRKMS